MQKTFRWRSDWLPGVIAGVILALGAAGAGPILAASGSSGLQFDGVDDQVTFGNATALGASVFTLETWFRWSGGGSAASSGASGVQAIPLLAKGRGEYDGDNRDMNYFLGIRTDGLLAADFEDNNGGVNHPVIGVTPITAGVWHHAAATYDGNEWRLYLDGILEANVVAGRTPRADSIQHASLGTALDSSGNAAGFFSGILDEARIWNIARTAGEIASNRLQVVVSAPGLIGRWSMDEGSGTLLQDSSGSGVMGTLLNGPLWVAGYTFATAPSVALTQPPDAALLFTPTNVAIAASASDPDGTVARVEFFADSTSLGVDSSSPFAIVWNGPDPGHYLLTAVATDNSGLSSTSAPVQITVEDGTVQITSPTHGTRWIPGLSVPVSATASDLSGTISQVEFFDGAVSLGTALEQPFTTVWNTAGLGEHTLRAVATASGGIRHTSAPVQVTVFNDQAPAVALTAPAGGAVFFAPTAMMLTAAATDSDGVVTNVQFYAGNSLLGEDAVAPYAWTWADVAVGNYALKAVAWDEWGSAATSAVVLVEVQLSAPPVVSAFMPPAGLVSNLTQISVTFSEPVVGVDAADLLINGVPATSVSGTNAQFTFGFAMPSEGVVSVSWAAAHGIVDRETPPQAFHAAGAGATVQYQQVDSLAPVVSRVTPPPGTVARTLSQVSVLFSEPVRGVQASALRLNGVPASSVSGVDRGPYVFAFAEPGSGAVQVSWSPDHGITDFSIITNAFRGAGWSYTLDPNASYEGAVVINEIMYHPFSENEAEEFIELYNTTADPINLAGWRFSRGVDFTFPDLVLAGRGYLVIAADRTGFASRYPAVTNVIGNWTGHLNNDDEELELEDAGGGRVDLVHYADGGDWAVRQRGVSSSGSYGWDWYAEHDGSAYNTAAGATVSNRTLELVNPHLPNSHGQNWNASAVSGGTPGAANTRATTNAAPLILEVAHNPVIPKPADSITVTARLVDEQSSGLTVALQYRNHSSRTPPSFTRAVMWDDGQHGDGQADDGVFGIVLAPQANGTVIEFYVEAADAQGNSRTWPAAARQQNGTFAQTANALLQVDENLAGVYLGGQPMCRLVMTESERYELEVISRSSDAQMNATLLYQDGTGIRLRYQAGVRVRGSGSRSRTPPNYRVNIPSDRRLDGLKAINLNTQFIHSQLAGSVLSLKSGVPTASGRVVQVRVNGANLARAGEPVRGSSTGSGFGSYILLEPLNADWAQRHFPLDGNGNAYRATSGWNANLGYNGTSPSSYSSAYTKASNVSENDFSDIIRLCYALSGGLPDPVYAQSVRTNANVEMWFRYFAVCSLLVYSENGLPTGEGDDFGLYRPILDPRFLLVPHDFDTTLGEGDDSYALWGTGASIWLAADRGGVPTLNRFMRHNEFAPIYFQELKRLAETTFSAAELNPLLDQYLGGWVPTATIDRMKLYAAQRVASVLSQIPQTFSVTTTLPISNGYLFTTAASVALSGSANALSTRDVRLNGTSATWTAYQGRWSGTANLSPGVNHVLVQCLDASGTEVARTNVVIWRDDSSIVTLDENIENSIALTAAGGPYLVNGDCYLDPGVVMSIEPGTTIYLADGASFHVRGQLLAEGTEGAHIRFTRVPGSTGNWRTIRFFGGYGEHRLRYVDIEYGGLQGAPNTTAEGAQVRFDHVAWARTTSQVLGLTNSSIQLIQSTLPSIQNGELIRFMTMPANGYALIQSNRFGTTTGGHDIVQFNGGKRPGPIAEILDNLFTGAVDDALEFVGADAHIEGNLFLHVHQDSARPDAAHAIATGRSGSATSELTIVRNGFVDCDHALLLQDGASAVFHHNTVVGVHTNATAAERASAISLGQAQSALPGGAGADLDGNIFWDLDGDRLVSGWAEGMNFRIRRSIVPGTLWPGEGNRNTDPLLVNLAGAGTNENTVRAALALRPGSPATGTGPDGLDMGALVPAGAVITGEPVSVGSSRVDLQACKLEYSIVSPK